MQLAKLAKLKPIILGVIAVIKANAPYSELLYMQILQRSWWHSLSRELARMLDKYILFNTKPRYHLKDFRPALLFPDKNFNPSQNALPGMLDTDETHLNGFGNRALIDGLLHPLTQKWLHLRGACKKGVPGSKKKNKRSKKSKGLGGK